MAGERDDDVRINEVLGLAGESLLDIGHQSNHHLGQTLGTVDAHVETRLLAVRRHVVWQQQVPTTDVLNIHRTSCVQSKQQKRLKPSIGYRAGFSWWGAWGPAHLGVTKRETVV